MNIRRIPLCLVRGLLCATLLISTHGALAQEAAQAAGVAAAAPTPALIRQGQNLFLGATRFSAGGPSCNACHNAVNDAVIGGGTLAMDLTESFGRLGADGIVETLPRKGAQSPFPVMQAAFQGRDITAEEGNALAAFLQEVQAKRATQKPNDLGSTMLLAGFSGVVFLLLLFSLVGQGRKRRSVNQEIYDRQVKSE
ncbi:MAG: hypothetical protein NTX56_15040 [Proteobacteria bacterium]|nr:hypothetical protein [Pseudomonadota bacterium]